MTDTELFECVRLELRYARSKYPDWPIDLIHAAAIAAEETGEVVKACNNFYWQQGDDSIDDIRKEAVQAIAMLFRFVTETKGMRNV